MVGIGDTFSFEQESVTRLGVEKVHYKWTIENFAYLDLPNGIDFGSTDFNSNEHKWCLIIFPGGREDEFKDYISIFIHLADLADLNKLDLKLKAKVKFFILNRSDEIVYSIGGYSAFYFDKDNDTWGFSNCVLRSDLLDKSKGLLVDDNLRLGVELTIIKDLEHVQVATKQLLAPVAHGALTKVTKRKTGESSTSNRKTKKAKK